MLKKRVALFLAAIMAVTSVDSTMLTVAAQEMTESVEEISLQETEEIEELFAEKVQENTEGISAEGVTENVEEWETETEEVKEKEGVLQETESDTEISTEEELFDETEVLIDNSAEVMEVYTEKGPKIVSVEAGTVREKDLALGLQWNLFEGLELKISYENDTVETISFDDSYFVTDKYGNRWDASAYYENESGDGYSDVFRGMKTGKYDVKVEGSGQEEKSLFTVNVKTPSEMITSAIKEGTQTVQAGSSDGDYVFYKWNPIKGKRYCFSNVDEKEIEPVFFRINVDGTYTEEETYSSYFLTSSDQYYVGFRSKDDVASGDIKVEKSSMISSIEVLDKGKISFVEGVESQEPEDYVLKIHWDDGTSKTCLSSSHGGEFDHRIKYARFKLDAQGEYNPNGDGVYDDEVAGKYVFHFWANYTEENKSLERSDMPYVDIPYEIVTTESVSQKKLENDKENEMEITNGYALYSFTPEKSGLYAFTSNLRMEYMVIKEAHSYINYWDEDEICDKYGAYVMLSGGVTYYIKMITSKQYEQAKLEIRKVKEITEISLNAKKKEYLADFETFDPTTTQTKVTFEDGTFMTISGYDSVERAMLCYNVSKGNSEEDWEYEPLESGEYTVAPYLEWSLTGSAIDSWKPTVQTDTIYAVTLDTDSLTSLKADIWNDITMTGEVGYYTFTAEQDGVYILEDNGEYALGRFYQKADSRWRERGTEISLKAGEECVIKLWYQEKRQVRISLEKEGTEPNPTPGEKVQKRIKKAKIVLLKEKNNVVEDVADYIAIDVTYEDETTERWDRNKWREGTDIYGNTFDFGWIGISDSKRYFGLYYYDYDNLEETAGKASLIVDMEPFSMLPEITEGKILSADLQSGQQYYQFVPEQTGEYVFKLNLLEHAYHHITVDKFTDEYDIKETLSGDYASFDDATGYVYEMKAGQHYVVTWEATTDVTEHENATLTLSRMKKMVKDVTVSKEPDNKEIFWQQTAAMCLSGLEVEVTYSDGSTEKVAYRKTDSEGRKLVLSHEVRLNGQTKRIYVSFGSYRVSVDLNIVGVDQLQTLTEGQTYTFAMAPEAYKYVRFEPEKTGKYYIDHSESGYYYCTCENDGTIVVRTSDGCCSLEKGKTYTFLVHSADPEGGIVRLGAYLHDTHSWNSGMVTKKATCKENGIRTYQCTVCSATKTDKIPVTNIHDFTKSTWTVTKEATAVAEGTKERTCSVCKKAKETQKTAKLKATYKLNVSGTVLLQCGKSFTLKVTGLAKGDRVVSWSSSNTKIATVKNGVVKAAKKTGSVTITIKLASDTVIRQTVKVQKAAVKVSSMAVAKTMWSVKQGETIRIVPTSFAPVTATSKTVTYSTSDKKVATVTSKGVVKGIAGGTAKITLKCGSAKVVCTVKVEPVKTKSIKLNKTAVSLKKKKTLTLKVTRTPKASTEKITFKSSDTKVATVNANGKITAKKAGTAVITVTCGSAKATCTVTVK